MSHNFRKWLWQVLLNYHVVLKLKMHGSSVHLSSEHYSNLEEFGRDFRPRFWHLIVFQDYESARQEFLRLYSIQSRGPIFFISRVPKKTTVLPCGLHISFNSKLSFNGIGLAAPARSTTGGHRNVIEHYTGFSL